MERLTERFDGWAMRKDCHGPCRTCDRCECADIYPMIDRLAAYEDTGLGPEEVERQSIALAQCKPYINAICDERGKMFINPIRLAELAQAEKDGRLVVLPCKPGVKIYKHCYIKNEKPIVQEHFLPPYVPILGKDIWLTREEAEAALKKREADNEKSDSNRL